MPTSGRFEGNYVQGFVYVNWQLTGQDVNGNYSNIDWQAGWRFAASPLDRQLDDGDVWINGQYVYNVPGRVKNYAGGPFTVRDWQMGSGSISIGHNADGTQSVTVTAGLTPYQNPRSEIVNQSQSLPTIPRSSTATFAGDNLLDPGVTETINTNRASASFTHNITYYFGSASGTIATGVGASTTWVPPLSLMNQIPNSASGTGHIQVDTYNGATFIGTTTTSFTLIVPSTVVPDFTTITHSEATPGVAANIGGYVQGVSTLALAITGAAGVYGSTISSYTIEVSGQTIHAVSGTSTPLSNSGTYNITGTITDSRGRVKQKTVSINVLSYAPPVLPAISVQRALISGAVDEDEGTYFRVNINASVSSLIVTTERNAINYRISTRVKGTSTWTVKANTSPGGISFNGFVTVGTYSITTSYEALVEVYDDFTTSATILTIPVAEIFMHFDGSLGVGIGKYRENGRLDVAGDIYVRENLTTGDKGFIVTDRIPHSGTTTERDLYYGVPGTDAQRVALANRSPQFFNVTTARLETYYALGSLSGLTVPGLAAGFSSGWYGVSTEWAGKAGPNAFVSAYIHAWSIGRDSGGFIDAHTNANNIIIGLTGTYEVVGQQRGANNSGGGYIALAVNGNRTTLENRTTGVYFHDHPALLHQYSTSKYLGTLNAGELITLGAPDSTAAANINFGSSSVTGGITVRRVS